jgi:hypothetical protein
MTFMTEGCYESTKIGIDLRRSARQIDQLTPSTLSRLQYQLHDIPFHDLISLGRGFEVAVRTPLVAPKPKIHL